MQGRCYRRMVIQINLIREKVSVQIIRKEHTHLRIYLCYLSYRIGHECSDIKQYYIRNIDNQGSQEGRLEGTPRKKIYIPFQYLFLYFERCHSLCQQLTQSEQFFHLMIYRLRVFIGIFYRLPHLFHVFRNITYQLGNRQN